MLLFSSSRFRRSIWRRWRRQMKFVCTTSNFRHLMGRLFANGLPTEVTDRATIMALEHNQDFKKVSDEKAIQETPKAPVLSVLSDECPKCGKVVKRGKFMHQKHC